MQILFLFLVLWSFSIFGKDNVGIKKLDPPKKEEEDPSFKRPKKELIKEFISSCEYGKFAGVRSAIETRLIDLNTKDHRGLSGLHAAAQNGQIEIVRYLLQFKVDLDTVSKKNETPLLSCLSRGHFDIARILIENGADIEFSTKDGKTPLMFASGNGNMEIVKILIEKKAKVNAKDKDGNTALFQALQSGEVEIIKYLVENKADVNTKNKEGKTPTMVATEVGLTDLVEYFSKNSPQAYAKNEVLVGKVSSIEGNVVRITPEKGMKLKVNHVIYFVDSSDTEIARGKVTITHPKYYKIKLESGTVSEGDKAVFYK